MKFKGKIKFWEVGLPLLILMALVLCGCAQTAKAPPGKVIPPPPKVAEVEPSRAFFDQTPSLSMEGLTTSAASLSEKAQSLSQEAEQLRAQARRPIQLASLPETKVALSPVAAPASQVLEKASSFSSQAQSLSQEAEQLRAQAKQPIQIASLQETRPLPPPATPSLAQMAEKSRSLSSQAQSLSQEAEQLRAQARRPIQLASLPETKVALSPLAAPASQVLEKASSFSSQAQSLSQEAEQLRAQLAAPPPGSVAKISPLGSQEQKVKVVEIPSALVPEKEVELFPSLQALGKKKEKGESPLSDVFFAYNESLLSVEAQSLLEKNAEWLRSHPEGQVLIEGHCDERGTVEYNLALGERRVQSAKDYLINLGVSKDRLLTISYGKERPFALGHTEEAWAQNRRAHFVLRSP